MLVKWSTSEDRRQRTSAETQQCTRQWRYSSECLQKFTRRGDTPYKRYHVRDSLYLIEFHHTQTYWSWKKDWSITILAIILLLWSTATYVKDFYTLTDGPVKAWVYGVVYEHEQEQVGSQNDHNDPKEGLWINYSPYNPTRLLRPPTDMVRTGSCWGHWYGTSNWKG